MFIQEDKSRQQILYSCYAARSRQGEQFIPEHVFSYQISGTLSISDGIKEHLFKEGDFRFSRRNHLMKFNKMPPENGEFKAVSVYLDQDTLRNFSLEYGYKAEKCQEANGILELKPDVLLKSYMDSLIAYPFSDGLGNAQLMSLKIREAILLLLRADPGLKDILFDFSEPGKINLEAFMNKNFHFNVQLKRFAYLSGRSLSTFKRDFEKIFNLTPSRWLMQKRLQEAYFLIKEKGRSPLDVYLELGFEDLSHFSFVFKKKYGAPPSRI